MQDFAKLMSDEELIDVVMATDKIALPMDRRFEGDTSALDDLMDRLNLQRTVVDKLLITGEVLRECVSRGIVIPRGN